MDNRPTNPEKPISVAVFGSTGSIGVSTLDVVRRNPGKFIISVLAANRNVDLLCEQAAEFHPKAVAIADAEAARQFKDRQPRIEVLSGNDGLRELASRGEYDVFVGALVGFAGLPSTLEAITLGKRVALANKESLVVAGELVSRVANETGSNIVPIDSEHSAIYQCLVGERAEHIRRIILTASGGPFRTRPKEEFPSITPAMALKHPKWVMGKKITIDSATLMNKGLEILEARWLFDVELSKIDVVVHPQSIVHSLVEFTDGSMKAQLGMPDMRLPIQYALEAPERVDTSYSALDLTQCGPLEFFEPDYEKFPCLTLAKTAGEQGGLYPSILNAANEVAVDAFLEERIPFTKIPTLISDAMDSIVTEPLETDPSIALDQISAYDRKTREWAEKQL